ncbi:MAG: N-6 DNA methylase, partial [Candidatus Marinimicrobia bacterium]|nr:N-6 DNA methylase [Candidatus Neomarinimicrobiota bacterium]
TFRLYETSFYGEKLDIKPLAGDLFSSNAVGLLNQCQLNNQVMLECLTNLSVFTNPDTQQKMRVNYASLNVEEFGSVYEGLLEYDPVLDINGDRVDFRLVKGSARSSSGSHYTPDELVQPLIKHSLNYIIEDKLKESNPEKALLSITVCDVACGSGHFLLGAARRIATELAKVRTGEDQPSPSAFREAVRDVIRHCIYGVDLNPLAVELAKVALWLEAHNPGEPLNFLDHKIKCGDAVVGLAHLAELENGIANEAFNKLSGDDETARTYAKKNKEEKKTRQSAIDFDKQVLKKIEDVNTAYADFSKMPESTPDEIISKQKAYHQLSSGTNWWRLKTLADIQTAQFFIPKKIEHAERLITENTYRDLLAGIKPLQGNIAIAKATAVAAEKRFFHWFLEFPEIFAKGGFSCILGNPPFLGGQRLSGTFGHNYLEWLKFEYAPAGSVDLVTYFFRRAFEIIQDTGFQSLIATNTIAQGSAREGGLAVIQEQGGVINYAVRSMRWPGLAAVEVAQVAIHKGNWEKDIVLDNKNVDQITSYLDDSEELGDPYKLYRNKDLSFQGSIALGSGFVLEPPEAKQLLSDNLKNNEVIFPYLIGHDLNNDPNQSSRRWIINFFDMDEERCKKNYPECFEIVEQLVRPYRSTLKRKIRREKWWQFAERASKLYSTIRQFNRVLARSLTSKHHTLTFIPTNITIDQTNLVFCKDDFAHYAIMQSNIHFEWVSKYSGDFGSTGRYNLNKSFEPFPFPQIDRLDLKSIGKSYYEFRQQLMGKIQLGLTKTYNQFHNHFLNADIENTENLNRVEFEKKFSKETIILWNHLQKTEDVCSMEEAVKDVIQFRQLHKEMDEAVLKAYGWHEDSVKWGPAIDLAHDFYEVDYLPENDRVRYAISPEARKEVLKRLLLLNHEIYEEEVKQGLHGKKKNPKATAKIKSKIINDPGQGSLFSGAQTTHTSLSGKTAAKKATIPDPSAQKVSHPTFGQGIVLSTEGHGDNAKLTIQFDSGEKMLQAKFVTVLE